MAKLIQHLGLLLLFSGELHSQITLEHTFPGTFSRVRLEFDGEKYYGTDSTGTILLLYNADYSLWKKIKIPDADGTNFWFIESVSQALFNQDNQVEYIYRLYSPTENSIRLANEEGVLVKEQDYCTIAVDIKTGVDSKIIMNCSKNSRVFSAEMKNLEKSYPGQVKRFVLEKSGEKFAALDSNGKRVQLFNADHSFWKEINTDSVHENIYEIMDISEKMTDPSGEIQVALYTSYQGVTVLKENGTVLLKAKCFNSWSYFTTIENKKQLVVCGKVYSFPALEREHEFPYPVSVYNLQDSSTIYSVAVNNTVFVYGTDFKERLVRTFSITSGHAPNSFELNDQRINQDSLFEFIYTSRHPTREEFKGRVSNENDSLLLEVPDADYLRVSAVGGGTRNKLVARTIDSSQVRRTLIYDLPTFDHSGKKSGYPPPPEKNSFSVHPNPSDGTFLITGLDGEFFAISLTDGLGKKMFEISTDKSSISLDLTSQPEGIYILQIRGEKEYKNQKLLLIR